MGIGKCYFIQCGQGGPIKIGYTKYSATQRLKDLQTSNPERLHLLGEITGTLKIEKQMHERFKKDNIRGEWFTATDELLDYIKLKCKTIAPSEIYFSGETCAIDPDGNKYYDTEKLANFLRISRNEAAKLCEQKIIKSIVHLRDYWVSFQDIIFFLHEHENQPAKE